jgi:hypothetical protein
VLDTQARLRADNACDQVAKLTLVANQYEVQVLVYFQGLCCRANDNLGA